jgi:predicted nucleic acid-binding protein
MTDTVTAVYDACVLYPLYLRDFLVWLGQPERNRLQARWSHEINEEWKRNLLYNQPNLRRERLDRTSAMMEKFIPNGLVTNYEYLIEELVLPDPNDRHVLAAAIHCKANIIVTRNLRDFPVTTLALYGIEALHPDDFVKKLFHLDSDLDENLVITAAIRQRENLVNPRLDVDRYLEVLFKQGLVQTVEILAKYKSIL